MKQIFTKIRYLRPISIAFQISAQFFIYLSIYLIISLMIYSSAIHFHLHPFLFNLSNSPSSVLFFSMNLKISFSESKPFTGFAAVVLVYVASTHHWLVLSSLTSLVSGSNSPDWLFCVNKSRQRLLILTYSSVQSYKRITILSITWKPS